MDKNNLQKWLPVFVFILLLIPIVTSSLLDLKQKALNKALEEARQNAEDRIYLLGEFDPATRTDFQLIPPAYNIGGYEMYLRNETLEAFLQMAQAAEQDDIELQIASATRNFVYQKDLWNKKWTGYTLVEDKNLSKSLPDGLARFEKILEYSAAPGTSRHHWGTDIDLNNANPQYFETGTGKEVYEWLVQNAPLFGFCQTYNQKGNKRPNGYNEEKWHWSYLPLARDFTQRYKKLITENDIIGFNGEDYVAEQDLINDYVIGINQDCV